MIGEMSNEDMAQRAALMMEVYARGTGGLPVCDLEDAPCDFLCDLMHHLGKHDFLAALARANMHYEEEADDGEEEADDGSEYVCAECGSEEVSHAMWVDLNTDDIGDVFGSWCQPDSSHCADCGTGVKIIRSAEYQDSQYAGEEGGEG